MIFAGQRRLQNFHAVFECFGEAFFLLLKYGGDAIFYGDKLGIRLAHGFHQIRNDVVKEGLFLPQLITVANRTANNAPQNITTAFVAGNHAVDNQECCGADVIGNDLE